MKVIQITTSPHQHKGKCLSEFLPSWFSGQSDGDNPIARGIKYGIKPQVEITKDDVIHLVRKGFVYLNQKKVPHFPYDIKGKSKIIIGLPDDFLNDKKSKSSKNSDAKIKSASLTKKDIVFEDDSMVVIIKPSGLPSQSTLNIFEDHALSALMSYYLENNKGIKAPYLNLMHRLDKDTSGLLLFSKKESANKYLTDLFEHRRMSKTYLAVALKNPIYKDLQEFTISGLIKKSPQPNMPFYFTMDDKEGQTSETDFKILKSNEKSFLIECHPKTGRSHQIRVHLKHAGLPILGDIFYNPLFKAPRLMLHAWKLEFKHPISSKLLELEAPTPVEFSI